MSRPKPVSAVRSCKDQSAVVCCANVWQAAVSARLHPTGIGWNVTEQFVVSSVVSKVKRQATTLQQNPMFIHSHVVILCNRA